LSNLLVT